MHVPVTMRTVPMRKPIRPMARPRAQIRVSVVSGGGTGTWGSGRERKGQGAAEGSCGEGNRPEQGVGERRTPVREERLLQAPVLHLAVVEVIR